MRFSPLVTLLFCALATGRLAAQSLDTAPPQALPDSVTATPLTWVKVSGNRFVNEKGDTLLFHGLSIADPDKVAKDGHWNRKHFEVIKSWGCNLVRLPVHPSAWRSRGQEAYLKLLDQAVQWCKELEMYVVVDWHSIGNLKMELFQDPSYDTSLKETYNFWRTIAVRYKAEPTVAFYEIYNEPTTFNGTLGKCTWEEWKEIQENCIDLIRANGAKGVPLVAGFNWAYELDPVRFQPIERENVAYVTHPYPQKCQPPRENNWDTHFGFAADRYPVVATEIGYQLPPAEVPLEEDGTYRDAIVRYFHRKHISYCVWVFDPHWVPQMISDWNYTPTHQGQFFRDVMLGKYKFD